MEKKENKEEVPEDIKLHENGFWYKEIPFEGLDEPFKLFNTLKPGRLPGEKYNEYKIRRMLEKQNKEVKVFHNSKKLGTYIKNQIEE